MFIIDKPKAHDQRRGRKEICRENTTTFNNVEKVTNN